MWQRTAWRMPPISRTAPEQLHVASRPALIGRTALTYHSEPANAQATCLPAGRPTPSTVLVKLGMSLGPAAHVLPLLTE